MMRTDAMRWFLRHQYTPERRAQLLAHAEEGRLEFLSCCCFIGVATADHALCGRELRYLSVVHYQNAQLLPGAHLAENQAYYFTGNGPDHLRHVVIRLVRTLNRWRDDRLASTESHELPAADVALALESEAVR